MLGYIEHLRSCFCRLKTRELESGNKFYDQDNSEHSQSLKDSFPEPIRVTQEIQA